MPSAAGHPKEPGRRVRCTLWLTGHELLADDVTIAEDATCARSVAEEVGKGAGALGEN